MNDSDVLVALEALSAEGLVLNSNQDYTVQGTPNRSKRGFGFISDYESEGRLPTIKSIVLEIIPNNSLVDEVKLSLNLDPTDFAIRHKSVQFVDGLPVAIADSYIPFNLFNSVYNKLRDSVIDLFDLMAECGHFPTYGEESIYVDVPNSEERDLLQLQKLGRINVARIKRIVRNESRVLEYCILCDRADVYEFQYSFPLVDPRR